MNAATLTFRPDEGSRLLAFAANVRAETLDDIRHDGHATRAYVMGSLEGELAFAVAATPDSLLLTMQGCQRELLLRLGLVGDLSIEQERLRGWIVGLIGSLSASFDAEE